MLFNLKKIILLLILTGAVFGLFYILPFIDERTYTNILLKYDSFGLTKTGRDEEDRLYMIDELAGQSVTFEQREALKSRTVFIGATKAMVRLAFGAPKSPVRHTEENNEIWVYYFDEYDRPIYLVFEGDFLVRAEKGSNTDLIEIK